MDYAHARGRPLSASGLVGHNVPAPERELSGRQCQGSGERYQEITAEVGAADEFMMWPRLEARMTWKHPSSPHIRYLGTIAGYAPGAQLEIQSERASNNTMRVLTTHTVQQLMNEDLCEQESVFMDMCATSHGRRDLV